MGNKHRHYDVIIAWAAGAEVELFSDTLNMWLPVGTTPAWDGKQYRVKPKTVKKEGWVNVYPDKYGNYEVRYHRTQYVADSHATPDRITCIRIEWEEEA